MRRTGIDRVFISVSLRKGQKMLKLIALRR